MIKKRERGRDHVVVNGRHETSLIVSTRNNIDNIKYFLYEQCRNPRYSNFQQVIKPRLNVLETYRGSAKGLWIIC